MTLAEEPCRANSFNLLIEGTTVGGFVSASGLGAQVDGIADRKAAAGTSVRNLPGLRRQDPLKLRYGIERRNISLMQYSDDVSSVADRGNLFNARPTKVPVGTLDVLLNEIAIETSDTGL